MAVRREAKTEAVCLILLVGAVAAGATVYKGIVGDAMHYTALSHYLNAPDRFGADLLYHQPQSLKSLYPLIYGLFIEWLDAPAAHLTLVLFGKLIWIAAAGALAAQFYDQRRVVALAVAAIILLNRRYGFEGEISYWESIAAPRLFGEALIISMFAARFAERWKLAALAAAAALLIHAVMALPAICLVLLTLAVDWRWKTGLAIFGVMGGFVLWALQIGPFALLFTTFDPEWSEVIATTMPNIQFSDWGLKFIAFAATPFAALVLISIGPGGAARQLAQATLFTSGVFLVVAVVGREVMDDVLLVNLQLWRALWLVAALGNLLALRVILGSGFSDAVRLSFGAALMANVLAAQLGAVPLIAAILSLAALALSQIDRLDRAGRTTQSLAKAVALAGAAAIIPLTAARLFALDDERIAIALLLHLSVTGLLLSVIWFLRDLLRSQASLTLLPVLCIGLFWGALNWDRRSEWKQFIENGQPPSQQLLGIVDDRNVYWEDGADIMWTRLQRPIYFSCLQGAGVLYDRDLAVKYRDRAEMLRRLNTADFSDRPKNYCYPREDPAGGGPKSVATLIEVCQTAPELDLMILMREVPGAPAQIWRLPQTFEMVETFRRNGEFSKVAVDRFFIYDCASLGARQ